MSTPSSSNAPGAEQNTDDFGPEYQRARANDVHLDHNEPQLEAEAGTPNYGDFGRPNSAATSASQPKRNDGSNDNPDEFSEFRKPDDRGTNADSANLMDQRGHVDQNQNPGAVNVTQDAENDETRAAWAEDDERYAGGHRKASWEENNDDEHSND
jgi:hypothetical protein